jgi:hypothetical protein
MFKTTESYVDIVISNFQNAENVCRQRNYQRICLFCVALMNEWLLFNGKWTFFSSSMTRRNHIRQDDEDVHYVFSTLSSIVIDWNMQ